jgi:uncharacterized membrane protein YuzA (DUF378 family)
MSGRRTGGTDDAEDPSQFAIPGGPAYSPPIAAIGAGLWALAIVSVGTVALFIDPGAVAISGPATVTRVLYSFVGVAAFVVLFPLFAHRRLRPAE